MSPGFQLGRRLLSFQPLKRQNEVTSDNFGFLNVDPCVLAGPRTPAARPASTGPAPRALSWLREPALTRDEALTCRAAELREVHPVTNHPAHRFTRPRYPKKEASSAHHRIGSIRIPAVLLTRSARHLKAAVSSPRP